MSQFESTIGTINMSQKIYLTVLVVISRICFGYLHPPENRVSAQGILESLINFGLINRRNTSLDYNGYQSAVGSYHQHQPVPEKNVESPPVLVPESPCPHYFQYIRNGNTMEGQILFKFKIFDPIIELKFEGSVPSILSSKYDGMIELSNSRSQLREDIERNRPLLYRVKFPMKFGIPKVTAIYYNDDLLCSGTPYGGLATDIKLEHRLETGIRDPNEDPSIYNEPDPVPDYFDAQRPRPPLSLISLQQDTRPTSTYKQHQQSKIIKVCMNLVFNGTHIIDKYFE